MSFYNAGKYFFAGFKQKQRLIQQSYSRKNFFMQSNISMKANHVNISGTNSLSSHLIHPRHLSFSCTRKHAGIYNYGLQTNANAARIVGCQRSFLNLHWLLWDEVVSVSKNLQKVSDDCNFLLEGMERFIRSYVNNCMQGWGLIVLLLSKAAGQHINPSQNILNKQNSLAEVTELIRTFHLLHHALINFPGTKNNNLKNDLMLTFGNKLALLSGDFLLSRASSELASLKNQEVVELMSSVIRDISEGEFIGPRDNQNTPLPLLQKDFKSAVDDWTLRNYLCSASLLAKSCQASLILSGHDVETQARGYEFGKHLALASQACSDLQPFNSGCQHINDAPFSLVSAPVLLQLHRDPSLFFEIQKGSNSVLDVDFSKVHKIVLNGPTVKETEELAQKHATEAEKILYKLDESDARSALLCVVSSVKVK